MYQLKGKQMTILDICVPFLSIIVWYCATNAMLTRTRDINLQSSFYILISCSIMKGRMSTYFFETGSPSSVSGSHDHLFWSSGLWFARVATSSPRTHLTSSIALRSSTLDSLSPFIATIHQESIITTRKRPFDPPHESGSQSQSTFSGKVEFKSLVQSQFSDHKVEN